MIIRVTEGDTDAELLQVEAGREIFKRISLRGLLNVLATVDNQETSIDIELLKDNDIIAYAPPFYLFYQEDMERYVTYAGRGYKIKFPKCVYLLKVSKRNDRVSYIEAYAIKEYMGEKTELFTYPYPNMLTQNRICIGSAITDIKDNCYHDALETILTTEYSHATFDGINGFKNTIDWFEYLEKNDFPYDLMKPLNRQLSSILHKKG